MSYIGSTLLLFAGLGLGIITLVLALYFYWKGKKTSDLFAGAVALVFVVRALQGLLQQSTGIACSMITGRGLLLHGLSAVVLAGLTILYLRELAGSRKDQDPR